MKQAKTIKLTLFAVFLAWTSIVQAQITSIDFYEVNNDTIGCEFIVINLDTDTNIQSSHPITNYTWLINNSVVGNAAQLGKTLTTTGCYDVTLQVTNAAGHTASLTKPCYIEIFPNPIANFTASQTTSCGAFDVILTNTSTGNIDSIIWQIGNDTFIRTGVDVFAPFHYSMDSIISCQLVSLTVFTPEGCSDQLSYNHYLCVYPVPNANFTWQQTGQCDTLTTIQFTNNSTHTSSLVYEWDFGDGSPKSNLPNPLHTYDTSGPFNVVLIAIDSVTNCSDTITSTVIINPSTNVVDFSMSSDTICLGDTIQFTDLSIGNITGMSWDFGDGPPNSPAQHPSHYYSSSGSYLVTLTITFSNSCTLTKSDSVYVSAYPTGNFTANHTSACTLPDTVSFTANLDSTVLEFYWDFEGNGDWKGKNDSTPTYIYDKYGTFPVSMMLINHAGCTTFIQDITIQLEEFVIDFSADVTSGCIPLTPIFTQQITHTSPINTPIWSMGNQPPFGLNSNTFFHLYHQPGEYNVTVTCTNALGCTTSVTKPNYIKAGSSPNLDFITSIDTACVNQNITFTNTSDPTAGNFRWYMAFEGDTTFLNNSQHLTYTFSDPGTYIIWLEGDYNDCDGMPKSDTIHIVPPKADFQAHFDCNNITTIQFSNLSIGANLTCQWDFDNDGTIDETLANPTYTYSSPGLYFVKLIVSNGICSDTIIKPIEIQGINANFTDTATYNCNLVPATIVVNNHSVGHSSCFWIAPGATYISGNTHSCSPVFRYDTVGYYDLTLIVTGENGCVDSITKVICVGDLVPNPIPDSGIVQFCGIDNFIDSNGVVTQDSLTQQDTLVCYWTGCAPLSVSFTDASYSVPDTPIVAWFWDFGDGTTSTDSNPTHIYQTSSGVGVFLVTLTITNALGWKVTDTVGIVRPTKPNTAFTLMDSVFCIGEDIGIMNQSSGIDLTYHWDFWNENTSDLREPNYSSTSSGEKIITLTVIDRNGCNSVLIDTIRIDAPISNFIADTLYSNCEALIVQFTNMSIDGDSWLWNFGDGTTSTLQHPTHTFYISRLYDITLTVTNSVTGCSHDTTFVNYINIDGPRIDSVVVNQQGCIDHEATFVAHGSNIYKYIWIPNTINSTTGNPDTIIHFGTNLLNGDSKAIRIPLFLI